MPSTSSRLSTKATALTEMTEKQDKYATSMASQYAAFEREKSQVMNLVERYYKCDPTMTGDDADKTLNFDGWLGQPGSTHAKGTACKASGLSPTEAQQFERTVSLAFLNKYFPPDRSSLLDDQLALNRYHSAGVPNGP